MKRLAISLIVGLALAAANSAEAASLGKQLVDLESHIKWSAVGKRAAKAGWLS
jgi:hypothetical protein